MIPPCTISISGFFPKALFVFRVGVLHKLADANAYNDYNNNGADNGQD